MAEDPGPVDDNRFELSTLPEDLLIQIFARLPVNTLFTFERVSRTWKRCVGPVLNKVKVVVFNDPEYCEPICSHLQLACRDQQTLFVNVLKLKQRSEWGYEINDENIDAIIRLLKRCPHVKCLDFDIATIHKLVNLKKLVSLFPELECLGLGLIAVDDRQEATLPWLLRTGDLADQVKVEWREFAEEVAPKLVHLKICRYFNLFDFNWNKNFDEIDSISPDKLIELNLLISGDRLRSVHLDFSKKKVNQPVAFDLAEPNFSHFLFLRELKKRPQVETTLGIDWLFSKYHFEGFDQLTFIFTKLSNATRFLLGAKAYEIVALVGKSCQAKLLKLVKLSSEQSVARKTMIVFKTLECLELNHVKLDENTFKCRFQTLETLNLINTSATDDAAFEKLFGSMQQLKKLIIKIDKLLPTYGHLPGQSLTVLKRMEKLEIDLAIENEEQIRMTELFEALMQMSWLKCIKIICNFNRYLLFSQIIKQALIVNIALLCLSSTKINVELRFNKHEFKVDESEEVMEWYAMSCRFEQISQKYTENEDIHKIEITKKS